MPSGTATPAHACSSWVYIGRVSPTPLTDDRVTASRPRVFVTRDLPGDALERLAQHVDVDVWPYERPPTQDELVTGATGCRGLITMLTETVGDDVLDVAPDLAVVANMAVGFDNIDVDACAARGVVVANTPGVLAQTTAELTIALMLAATRRIVEAADAVKQGRWPDWHPGWMLGQDVDGATLGIVGMGDIGRRVADIARGLGMDVIHHNRSSGVPLDDLLRTSDVVSLHCPLTPATHHLIGARELALMKPTAVLVNMARGDVVDTDALVTALRERTIFGAGLDVTPEEPLPTDHPLLGLPNCTVLPHIGSASVRTRSTMANLVVDNVLAVLDGNAPLTPVPGSA